MDHSHNEHNNHEKTHNHEEKVLHDANNHKGHHSGDFLKKFWLSFILTIPIVLYSDLSRKLFSFELPVFFGSEYLNLILGSIVFFYGGMVFLRGAFQEIKKRLPGMMTLIGLAITTAYIWSVYAVFAKEETLFWELSTLITIMLLGHFVEMKAVQGAKGALQELSKLLPDTALVLKGGKELLVPISELAIGDTVLVKPGAKIPTDGEVISEQSEVNESIITGESRPVRKKKGDEVIAGSINGDGALIVRVTKIGEQTFLSGVMRLVAEAESSKSRLQLLSDKAAFWLTVLAVGGGTITFVSWIFSGAGAAFSTERLVAVLVIACPHALGLAIPLVASISTTMAAKNGFLVKRRLALEAARKINIVLFDKTGTLTEGRFSVTSTSSDEALAFAASVDAKSEHPIARAILEEAQKRKLEIKEASDFKRLPGIGAEAIVSGQKVFVGHRGGSDILVEVDGKTAGTISVADSIRPESLEAVRVLKSAGLSITMITGDSEDVAKSVAAELGIDEYFARVAPKDKADKVKILQRGGKKVAFVGDGVNDAPALTQSDLGIAIGAGTNVAIESAGIILVKNDPRDISKIIKLSRMTYSKMIQNLFWATGYNILAMPLAAGALYAWGIMLEPAVAAVLMSLSTVIVAFNAALLRKKTI